MAARSPGSPINVGDLIAGQARTQTVGFVDPNQRDWIVMNDTVNAVNALMVQNNVAGSPVVLTVGGQNSDTNAGMTIAQLGTATLTVGVSTGTVSIIGATVNFPSTSITVVNLTATGFINTSALTVTGQTVGVGGNKIWAPTGTATVTIPTGLNATLAALPVTQSFTAPQTVSVANVGAFAVVAAAGTTVFNVDTSVASVANGLSVSGSASASGVSMTVLSAGPNETLTINSKGTGNVKIGTNGATGNIGSLKFFDQTLGSASVQFSVTSIPSGFSGMRFFFQGQSTQAASSSQLMIRLNADSGGNYDHDFISGNGITVSETFAAGQTQAVVGLVPGLSVSRTSMAGVVRGEIPNYAGTTFEKSFVSSSASPDSTQTNAFTSTGGGNWRNTGAVTNMLFFVNSGSSNMTTGSRLVVMLEN